MTITELLEQAKLLSPEERVELIQKLAAIHFEDASKSVATQTHWGQSLNQIMIEIGTIEMKYPDIDDPIRL